jgi:hypothetical protein
MASNGERNKKIIADLLKRPENKHCADCGAKGTAVPGRLGTREKLYPEVLLADARVVCAISQRHGGRLPPWASSSALNAVGFIVILAYTFRLCGPPPLMNGRTSKWR